MNSFNKEKVIEMEDREDVIGKIGILTINNHEYFFARDDRFIAKASGTEIDRDNDCNGLFFNVEKKILGYWITKPDGEKVPIIIGNHKHNVVNQDSFCHLVREYKEILNKYRNYSLYDLVYDIIEGESITGGKAPAKEIISSQNMNCSMYFYETSGMIIVRVGNKTPQIIQNVVFFDVEDFIAFAKECGQFCRNYNFDFVKDYIKGGLINKHYLKFVTTNENMLRKLENTDMAMARLGIRSQISQRVMFSDMCNFTDFNKEYEIVDKKLTALTLLEQIKKLMDICFQKNSKIDNEKKCRLCHQISELAQICLSMAESESVNGNESELTSLIPSLKVIIKEMKDAEMEYARSEIRVEIAKKLPRCLRTHETHELLEQLTTSALFKQIKKLMNVYFQEKSKSGNKVEYELCNRIVKLTKTCLSKALKESANGNKSKLTSLIPDLVAIIKEMKNQPIYIGIAPENNNMWDNFDNDFFKRKAAEEILSNLHRSTQEINKRSSNKSTNSWMNLD